MNTRYIIHTIKEEQVLELNPSEMMINNAQDFLQMMVNLPADRFIIHKESLNEDFFDLKTGLAGEILQKVVNYYRQVAIVGDFSGYNSKSLNDFICESNKSKHVAFTNTVEEAIKKLSI